MHAHPHPHHRLQRLLLASTLTALLAACGGGGDPAADPTASAPAPAPGPAPAPAPAPPAPAPAPAPAPSPAPAPAPTGWGSVTVSSTALAADRGITPNRLPGFDPEATSLGAGRSLSVQQAVNPLQGDSAFDSVTVRFVAATGQVLSAAVVVVPDPTLPLGGRNYYASCSPCSGVTVDLAGGSVSFAGTALTATMLSGSSAAATLNGSLRLPDYRPRSGTTVTAAALAACSVTPNLTAATFADIGCLAGTYVGTGTEGQACTVTVDATAQRFRFDDGVKTVSHGFSSGGGFTNMVAMRTSLTQLAKMSNPSNPLESIDVQASPVAGFANLVKLDLQAIQLQGGTLSSVYERKCRIEFDTTAP